MNNLITLSKNNRYIDQLRWNDPHIFDAVAFFYSFHFDQVDENKVEDGAIYFFSVN